MRPEELAEGAEFSGGAEDDLLDAGLALAAESKAVEYLARAEQSRFSLSRKLSAKKFGKKYVDMALDYLESVGCLSDGRFARAWLNARRISHSEGRARLRRELAARGIAADVAEAALDEFFAETQEQELCRRALRKYLRLHHGAAGGGKVIRALSARGFGYGMIREVMTEEGIPDFSGAAGDADADL